MKHYFTLLLLVVLYSCQNQNELTPEQSPINSEHKSAILNGNFGHFTDIESWKDSKSALHLKSANTYKSLWDIKNQLDELYNDSTKLDDLQNFINTHSNVLRLEKGYYQIITDSKLIAKTFNKNGILNIGNYIYILRENHIYKYENKNSQLKLITKSKRTFTSSQYSGNKYKSANSSLRPGSYWVNTFTVTKRLSSNRCVDIWLIEEHNPELGCYTVGAKSAYFRGLPGAGRLHRSRNALGVVLTNGRKAYDEATRRQVYNCATIDLYQPSAPSILHYDIGYAAYWRSYEANGRPWPIDKPDTIVTHNEFYGIKPQ